MPQIRSSDLRDLHGLMMQAHKQNSRNGYEVWADTIFMYVYRSKDDKVEYTKGARTKRGEIIFKPMENRNDI